MKASHSLLLGLSLATVAVVGVASFFPDARLWGINHLAYFPVPLRLALLGLVVVCFVPPFARLLLEGFLSAVRLLERRQRAMTWAVLAVALASVALFWTLRMGTPLLGDGHLLAKSYNAAQGGNPNLIPSSMENILQAERIAIGTAMLNHWSGRLMHQVAGWSWLDGWRLMNCVLGGIFVWVMLLVARARGWTTMTRLWLLALVLFSPLMEVFFGYVENYTPLTLMLLLYAVSAVRVLHFRGSLLWPILTWILATFLHIQALVFLPSLVYLVAWRRVPHDEGFAERRLVPWLLVGMVVGVGLLWLTPARGHLLTWVSSEGGQAVLTLGHAADALNELWLVLPSLALFLGLQAVAGRHAPWERARPLEVATTEAPTPKRKSKSKARPATPAPAPRAPAAAWMQTRAEWQFFLVAAFGCLLYLLFFDAAIGVARDWDLFSMTLMPLVPLCLIIWNRAIETAGGFDLQRHALVAMPMIALTLVMGMTWVLLNHSVARSTQRFESILGWETARIDYGLEALAATYYDAGHPDDAVRIMERAIVVSPNKRLRALLGTYYFDAGDYVAARRYLEPEVARKPRDATIRTWLIRTLHKLEDFKTEERVLRQGVQLHPDNTSYHLLLGELLINRGKVEEGVRHLRLGAQGDIPPAARAQVEALIRRHTGQPR